MKKKAACASCQSASSKHNGWFLFFFLFLLSITRTSVSHLEASFPRGKALSSFPIDGRSFTFSRAYLHCRRVFNLSKPQSRGPNFFFFFCLTGSESTTMKLRRRNIGCESGGGEWVVSPSHLNRLLTGLGIDLTTR